MLAFFTIKVLDMLQINGESKTPQRVNLVVTSDDCVHDQIEYEFQSYLKLSDDDVCERIYKAVNRFFTRLSDEQRTTIALFYESSGTFIAGSEYMPLDNLKRGLQIRIGNMLGTTNLITEIDSFCKEDEDIQKAYPNRVVSVLSGHSDSKTFVMEHYKQVIALSLLGRIMVPIWGILNTYLIKRNQVVSLQIDAFMWDIISQNVRSSVVHQTFTKLEGFSDDLAQDKVFRYNRKIDVEDVLKHHNLTMSEFCGLVFARVMTRRLPVFDENGLEGSAPPNVMIYVDDGIKRTAETMFSTMITTYQKNNGKRTIFFDDDLMFSQDDVIAAESPSVRAFRQFMFDEGVTNGRFNRVYSQHARDNHPEQSREDTGKMLGVDRRFLRNPKKITKKMMEITIDMLGYNILAFEYDDTQAKLEVEKKHPIKIGVSADELGR